MFISEQERFDRHPLNRTKFQFEEKMKKKAIKDKKLEELRSNQDTLRARIEYETAMQEAKDQNHLRQKSLVMTDYERVLKFS